jgi:hypothetical protein
MTATDETSPDGAAAADGTNGRRRRQHATRPLPPVEQRSLGELIATLGRDIALLVHQEIELVKAELVAALRKIGVGAAAFAVAGVLALFALPLLSIAVALGVHALGVSLGWSFLIVAGGYLLLAAVAALLGVRLVKKTKAPKRAVGSVKADLRALTRKPKPDADQPAPSAVSPASPRP